MNDQGLLGLANGAETIIINSLDETEAWGARFALCLQAGDIVYLKGAMGAGKSSLCRSIIRSLVADVGDVPSPTFSLIQTYEADKFLIHHLDLYRLERPEDTLELGLDELNFGAVMLIEWPERLGPYGFGSRFEIEMTQAGPEGDALFASRI